MSRDNTLFVLTAFIFCLVQMILSKIKNNPMTRCTASSVPERDSRSRCSQEILRISFISQVSWDRLSL